jgi:polar amino acid transport system substrate-binding protein
MEFGAMLPALIAGKVDMIGAGLSITEERAKRILYSESYYPSGIAVVVRSGGEPAPGRSTAKMREASDIHDKTIGVMLGSVYDRYTTRTYPQAKVQQYQSRSDVLMALNSGKIDAAFYDQDSLPPMLKANPTLGVLAKNVFSSQIGAGFNRDDGPLREQFNAFLKEIRSNGTYDDMVKRWMEQGSTEMPKIDTPNKNGVLRAGVVNDLGMPYSLIKDGQIIGFDIELGSRFAAYTGREYQPVPLQFGSLIASIATHKIDIITASMFITEERKKMIDFSDPYHESGGSLIARNDRIEPAPSAGELAGKNNPSGIAVVVRAGSKPAPSGSTAMMREANDVRDKTIGVVLGSTSDTYASRTYPQAKILQYQSITDMVTALNSGKIDVAFFRQFSAPEMLKANPTLGILAKDIYSFPVGAGFNKDHPALRHQFNAFLKEIRSNGTYDDMVKRWVQEGRMEMPRIESSNKNGVLRAGVLDDAGMPFSLTKDGQLIGFDIEIASRFAAYTGREYQPVPLQFGSLIASLVTHKIDIIAASMFITEERKKTIDFSDPYYESGISIIARKDRIERATSAPMSSTDDLAGKKIGVFTGTVFDGFVQQKYPTAQIYRYESPSDMVLSLETGKVDAALFDLITARLLMKHNPDLGLLSENVLSTPLGVGFSKSNPGLRNDFNDFLREIRSDGTYDAMAARWFTGDAETAVMPTIPPTLAGRRLVAGVSINDLPYVAYKDGSYEGFDIEMLQSFAQRKGYKLEIVTMEFSALITALAVGKVELIADGISISEERKKQIDFSDSYADFRAAVVAAKKNLAQYAGSEAGPTSKPFFKRLADSFYSNIILENRYRLILDGLKLTILISIFAALFGTVLGGVVCYMRMSKNGFLSRTAAVYISLLRGTPVLVLLMIIYYIVFASVNINPAIVAVIAFGMNFAAYVSEMFRTSIQSVDPGQKEAGIAGGFTKVQTFVYIISPQALRHLLPVYKGEFISLVKMTSIVGYIAVQDLTKASDIIRSRTFDAFFPLIMAAVIYLLLAWLLTWALGAIEISVDPKRRTLKQLPEAKR